VAVVLTTLLFTLIGTIGGQNPVSARPSGAAGGDQAVGGTFLVPADLDLQGFAKVDIHNYGPARLVMIDDVRQMSPELLARLTPVADASAIQYRGWSGPADVVNVGDGQDGYYLVALAGPIDPNWLPAMRSASVRIVDTIAPYGYVVRANAHTLNRIAAFRTSEGFNLVRGIVPVPVESKLDQALLAVANGVANLSDIAGARLGADGRAVVRVFAFADQNEEQVLSAVAAYADRASGAIGYGYPDAFLVTGAELWTILQNVPGVSYVELQHERKLMNNLAAKSSVLDVESMWNAGYTGTGVKVNHNDSGIDPHADFPSGTITASIGNMTGTDNSHGTHTAGSVLGRGLAGSSPTNTNSCGDLTTPLSTVKGMAYGATINSNNLFSPGSTGQTTEDGMMKWAQDNASQLSTNSWGYTNSYTYGSQAVTIDRAVRDADTTEAGNQALAILFAAGNDGSGAGTVGNPGTGKNAITVGASYNVRCGSYTSGTPSPATFDGYLNKVVDFSGRGPSQTRIKPDFVSTGANVLSVASDDAQATHSWDQAWTGANYELMPGTSMATPIAAGAAAVFYQHYKANSGGGAWPSPALAKASLINGAVAMTGYTYENTASGTYAQGWGRLNLRNTCLGPSGGTIKYVDEAATGLTTGQSSTRTITVNSSTVPLKITVVWTDPPGASGSSAPLINNLDLIVTAPNGTVYRGNKFTGTWSTANPSGTDTANNVENVFVQSPATGTWTIEVRSANTAQNVSGKTGQDFALVYSGNLSDGGTPTPNFSLSSNPSALTINAGASGTSTITSSVTGGFNSAVSLSVSGAPAGTTASLSPTSFAAPGSGDSTLTVNVGASTTPGSYTLTVTGTGGSLTRTTTVALTVPAPCGSANSPITSGTPINGALATTDCASTVRTTGTFYYDNYTFSAVSGTQYTITLNSTAFDTYLYLLNGSTVLAQDDDGNGGTNSKIVYTPTSSGTLTIHCTSYSASATGSYTVSLSGGTTTTPPAAPSGLTATAASSSQINLVWTDNSTNETGFEIDRKTGSTGSWSQIATTGAGVTSYSNTGLTASTTYYYRVRATNSAGDSADSNEASATTSGSGCSSSTTAISVGGSGSGSLATTDCASTVRTGGTFYYDNFTFSAVSGTQYTITLNSTAFDTYLYLLNGSTVLAQDDDGNGGTNSKIVYTATSSGTLTIHCTSYSAAAVGTYTVALSGSSTGTELVTNGGFDTGAWSPWTIASRAYLQNSGAQAGTWCAKLLGVGTSGSGTLYQTPAFPTTGATKTLRFYMKMSSAEGTTTAYDRLYVRITNSSNTTLTTLATYSNVNKNTYADWTLVTLSIPASYAVSPNRLRFYATEDSTLQTTFYIDSVSIQ
jgi:hypothetical protein